MNIRSTCCSAPVIEGHRKFYPTHTNHPAFYILQKTDVCEACGQEAEEVVECCDVCGEPAEKFFKVDGDDYCPHCFNERLDEEIRLLKARYGIGS